jgi:broad specificity phosphatase PhoE
VLTLHLVRHGQASYGAAEYDRLSDLGRAQAASLSAAPLGPLRQIWVGPLARQRDTAAALAGAHPAARVDVLDELAEYPAFELLRAALPTLVQRDPQLAPLRQASASDRHDPALLDRAFGQCIGAWIRGELDAPDLEPYATFVRRVERGLAVMAAAMDHEPSEAAAVTSAGPISVLLARTLGAPVESALRAGRLVRNASITTLQLRPARGAASTGAHDLALLAYNDVAHLPTDQRTHR